MRRCCMVLLATACLAGVTEATTAPPARASIINTGCGILGAFSGLAGKACNVVTGPVGKLVGKVLGGGSSASSHAKTFAEILAVGAAAYASARLALKVVTKAINDTTSPQLTSTWFSATYLRVTAIAALLTLPFLFAAGIQALMHSDMSLLIRAAFGYLPLAALATAIAAPVTMLLLAGSNEMSALVSSAAGSGQHLISTTIDVTGLGAIAKDSPFLLLTVGMLAIGAALAVWIELAVREAAVYVIVLMLPLTFAAMVWPARRVWAIRAVEMLIALILSKFAIVAVLTLGAGALGHGGVLAAMAGIALLILAAFCPWMLMRLLPMAELAGAAAGSMGGVLRQHGESGLNKVGAHAPLSEWRDKAADAISTIPARLRGDAVDADAFHRTAAGSHGGGGGAIANPAMSASSNGASDAGNGGSAGTSGDGGGSAAGGGFGGGGGAGSPSAGNSPNGHPGGTPVSATASGNGAGGEERLPGLGPIWQAPDNAHRPLTLGPDDFDPAPPLAYESATTGDPGGAEDHDPLPERQPDADGDE